MNIVDKYLSLNIPRLWDSNPRAEAVATLHRADRSNASALIEMEENMLDYRIISISAPRADRRDVGPYLNLDPIEEATGR